MISSNSHLHNNIMDYVIYYLKDEHVMVQQESIQMLPDPPPRMGSGNKTNEQLFCRYINFRFTYHNVYDEEDIDSYDYNGNGPYDDAPHSA